MRLLHVTGQVQVLYREDPDVFVGILDINELHAKMTEHHTHQP